MVGYNAPVKKNLFPAIVMGIVTTVFAFGAILGNHQRVEAIRADELRWRQADDRCEDFRFHLRAVVFADDGPKTPAALEKVTKEIENRIREAEAEREALGKEFKRRHGREPRRY